MVIVVHSSKNLICQSSFETNFLTVRFHKLLCQLFESKYAIKVQNIYPYTVYVIWWTHRCLSLNNSAIVVHSSRNLICQSSFETNFLTLRFNKLLCQLFESKDAIKMPNICCYS